MIQGVERLKKKLKKLQKNLDKIIAEGQQEAASVLVKSLVAAAPKDSGLLASSIIKTQAKIGKEVVKTFVEVLGGHDSPMVAAIEYGTQIMGAEPFIRPTMAAKRATMKRVFGDSVAKAIEDVIS